MPVKLIIHSSPQKIIQPFVFFAIFAQSHLFPSIPGYSSYVCQTTTLTNREWILENLRWFRIPHGVLQKEEFVQALMNRTLMTFRGNHMKQNSLFCFMF